MSRATLLVLCFSFGLTGCGAMQATQKMREYVRTTYNPNPTGPRDGVDDDNVIDRDLEKTMLGARSSSGVGKSSEPDKWWSDHIMSSEARSIERNLGVEYY